MQIDTSTPKAAETCLFEILHMSCDVSIMVVVLTFVGAEGSTWMCIFGFFAALVLFESLSSESLRISCFESIAVVVSTLVGLPLGET